MEVAIEDGSSQGQERPYTVNSFQTKLRSFEKLMGKFTMRHSTASPEQRRQIIADNTAAFQKLCDDLRELFGTDIRDDDLKQLHRKICADPDSKIDWSEVFGYFNVDTDEESAFSGNDISVFATSLRICIGEAAGERKRRDVAKSIRYVKPLDSYVVAAQKGTVTFWNRKLEIASCTAVDDSLWLADCDFLPNLKKMISCTEKSLIVWDPRTKANSSRMFAIKPFANILHSMCVIPHHKLNEDAVLVGDDLGNIIMVKLSIHDLTSKNATVVQATDLNEVIQIDPAKLHSPIILKKVHPALVSKIKYFPELNCFGSSSISSTTSFVLEEIHRLQSTEELRGFSIPKGVSCFDYSTSTSVIVTGGADRTLRIYHPHIDKPTAKLKGHLFTITDLCINDVDKHVISLSSARVIRVWDLLTLANLQVFSDKEDRLGEKRIYCMMFDHNLEVLITGSSVIDYWPLTRNTKGASQPPVTHEKPLSQILFNEPLRQLVSICTFPLIKVWDVKSGKLVYKIAEPHGQGVEITSAALDAGGYKMVTGGSDGSVKTWDCGTGRPLKTLEDVLVNNRARKGKGLAVQNVCLHTVEKQKMVLAYFANGRFKMFADPERIQYLQYVKDFDDTSSEGRVLQRKKITCLYLYPPEHVITGFMDGSLAFWNLRTRSLEKIMPPQSVTAGEINNDGDDDDSEPIHQMNAVFILRNIPVESKKNAAKPPAKSKASDNILLSNLQSSELNIHDSVQNKDSRPQNAITPAERENTMGFSDEVVIKPVTQQAIEASRQSAFTPNGTNDNVIELFVTIHQDSYLRFRDINGNLLLERIPEMRHVNAPLTAVAQDESGCLLVTGDYSGYLTLWRITDLIAKLPLPLHAEDVVQVVTWRGHLSRVVGLTIVNIDGKSIVYSASIDGSVRLWSPQRGRYLGYMGQVGPFEFESFDNAEDTPTRPCDITEFPIEHEQIAIRESRPKNPPKLEVPLIQAKDKSAPVRRPDTGGEPYSDRSFFKTLVKPKAYNTHLELIEEPKHSNKDGFVFRSLPVYKVISPERPKTPVLEKGLKTSQSDQGNINKIKKK